MSTTSGARSMVSFELEDTPPVPASVGRYEVRDQLGAGAMGVVYRAYDPELDRFVAIKLVRVGADASSEARLMREAQALARLRHPNIVRIYDVGLTRGAVFIVMELLEGGTLRRWLQGGPCSLDEILDRFLAAGRGLAAAHTEHLVHRDFKPDNVLLDASGAVYVGDFGLARLANGEVARSNADVLRAELLSQAGAVAGTPPYMSPEQLCGGPVDARADQFSFCVALWEGVYGERPFSRTIGGTSDLLRARLTAIAAGPDPPRRRDRPGWITELLQRGLASDPDRRWPTLQALLEAIAAHRAPPPRRWWRFAAALGAIGLAIAALAVLVPRPAKTVPQFHLAPRLHRNDLRAAAISPDGSQLALVSHGALVVRGIDAEAQDRVVIEHGIGDWPPVWSPDGKRLLASTPPDIAGQMQMTLIDVDRGTQRKLPVTGFAVFLSDAEVAVTLYRRRAIEIVAVDEPLTLAGRCPVDGDYTLLQRLVGLPDGTMVVETVKDERHTLVILRRDCQVRARFAAESISSFAINDAGNLIALVGGDGFRELLEISLDGVVKSRRRISGDIDMILGRRHGTDYVATHAPRTHLDQIHDWGPPQRLLSVPGRASFSLAPDGDTLAWIELAGHARERGKLWRTSLRGDAQGEPLLRDNAVTAGWSPDGRSLAVLIDDDRGLAIVVIDRSGHELRRLSLPHLARNAAPVWWDDHHILALSDDGLAYQSFDLASSEQRDAMDSDHGGTCWLTRSPRDGTLAMWRNGAGATGPRTEHLWLQPSGGQARPLPAHDATQSYLSPSWSPAGELFVRAFQTGAVSRVAPDTGELTQVAQLGELPMPPFENHLLFLTEHDVLAVEIDLAMDIWEAVPDETLKPLLPAELGAGQF